MTLWKAVDTLSTTAEFPLDELIRRRGHDVDVFLNPSYDHFHDPLLMKDMQAAVDRMMEAKDKDENVRVMGDYDADGITSTYTLMTMLYRAGLEVSYDIPNRSEGYGMNKNMIDKAYKDGVTLIITCDNGISAIDEVEYAKQLGIDVIVTDHHEPKDQIPNTIVVNPMRHDCPYPFKSLAGCAVAWKFGTAFLQAAFGRSKGWLMALDIIEIPAIGTIADVMELVGENRVIVTYGLRQLRETKNIGLQELMKALELTEEDPNTGKMRFKEITAGTVGFKIGPALNATGRLLSAKEAVDMLLERSRLKAFRSADYLIQLNNERKELTERFSREILEHLEGTDTPIVTHVNADIPEGIIGVIASRVKEKLARPVLIMTYDEHGKVLKGSGRSIEEYDMYQEVVTKHHDLFVRAGGHAMACGFSILPENVPALASILIAECNLDPEDITPKLMIDYEVDPDIIDSMFAEDLIRMEPFGKGNPKPLFLMKRLQVTKASFIGKEKQHLKLTLTAPNRMSFDCIGFSMVDKYDQIQWQFHEDDPVYLDIVFYPGINVWNGQRNLQLELTDIRAAE